MDSRDVQLQPARRSEGRNRSLTIELTTDSPLATDPFNGRIRARHRGRARPRRWARPWKRSRPRCRCRCRCWRWSWSWRDCRCRGWCRCCSRCRDGRGRSSRSSGWCRRWCAWARRTQCQRLIANVPHSPKVSASACHPIKLVATIANVGTGHHRPHTALPV
jgi:hypothetical protein